MNKFLSYCFIIFLGLAVIDSSGAIQLDALLSGNVLVLNDLNNEEETETEKETEKEEKEENLHQHSSKKSNLRLRFLYAVDHTVPADLDGSAFNSYTTYNQTEFHDLFILHEVYRL